MPFIARSYLYVPGDRDEVLAKAPLRGADALVLDLEDAVVESRKKDARATVRAFLAGADAGADADAVPGPELWVRINSDRVDEDVRAVASPALSGVWVPKAEPALLRDVDALLTAEEEKIGLAVGTFRVVALLETARGVLAASDVAASPRVLRLGIGEADLAGELGLQPGPDREELSPIRSQVVVASAAAAIIPPVGPVETSIRDLDRLQQTTRRLLRQGFRARTAVHPGQLKVINDVFSPSPAEVAAARAVLDRLAEAEHLGSGVATDVDGRMLDRAVVRSAREVLQRARQGTP
jgi:citrate lyase subunit beta/citryl-CoA lyase